MFKTKRKPTYCKIITGFNCSWHGCKSFLSSDNSRLWQGCDGGSNWAPAVDDRGYNNKMFPCTENRRTQLRREFLSWGPLISRAYSALNVVAKRRGHLSRDHRQHLHVWKVDRFYFDHKRHAWHVGWFLFWLRDYTGITD